MITQEIPIEFVPELTYRIIKYFGNIYQGSKVAKEHHGKFIIKSDGIYVNINKYWLSNTGILYLYLKLFSPSEAARLCYDDSYIKENLYDPQVLYLYQSYIKKCLSQWTFITASPSKYITYNIFVDFQHLGP